MKKKSALLFITIFYYRPEQVDQGFNHIWIIFFNRMCYVETKFVLIPLNTNKNNTLQTKLKQTSKCKNDCVKKIVTRHNMCR